MTRRFLALCLGCALVAACGNDTTNGTVSAPSDTRTTDTFSGTVAVGGSAFNSFPVSKPGETDVTLTVANPNVPVGLAIGTPGDAGCTPLLGASSTVVAGSTPQVTGVTTAGTLCVQVRDVGEQTSAVTYTVTVTHP